MPKLPYPQASLFGLGLIVVILALNLGINLLVEYPTRSVFGDAWLAVIPSSMAVNFEPYMGLWYGTGGLPWPYLPTLITYGYSHIGWDHVAFNMVPFVPLAWLTVRRNGGIAFFLLYHGIMVATALVHVLVDIMALEGYFQTNTGFRGVVGASGAVHGLGGLWVTWAWRDRIGTWGHRLWPAALWMAVIIAANIWLIIVLDWGFAWELHIAGVVIGMLLAFVIPARKPAPQQPIGQHG
jgi:membrane associated rhomboid family serine protease